MNIGSTDRSQQQSFSSNQSTGGKDATMFSKSGKSYLLSFIYLFISKQIHTIGSECSTSMRGSEIERKMCANELGRHLVLVSTNSDKIFDFEEMKES